MTAHPNVRRTVGLVLYTKRLVLLQCCMQVGPLEFSATTGTAHELHNGMSRILQLKKKIIS